MREEQKVSVMSNNAMYSVKLCVQGGRTVLGACILLYTVGNVYFMQNIMTERMGVINFHAIFAGLGAVLRCGRMLSNTTIATLPATATRHYAQTSGTHDLCATQYVLK